MCKGTSEYIHEKHFPNCLWFNYHINHYIYIIHGHYLRIRNSKTEHGFKMTEKYILNEIIINAKKYFTRLPNLSQILEVKDINSIDLSNFFLY